MELVTASITPELTSPLTAQFGVSDEAAAAALKTSAAAMLITLAAKANDLTFLKGIYTLLTGADAMAAATGVGGYGYALPAASVTPAAFLHQLFGINVGSVEATVASAASIPVPAAGAMLTAAAPLVLEALSQRIETGGLSIGAFASALTAELPSLRGLLPATFAIPGLTIPSVFSAPAPSEINPSTDDRTPGAAGWLWPVLIAGAILIGALIWYFDRADATGHPPVASSFVPDSATPPPPAVPLGSFVKRKLPGGFELNIPENGIENKLINFIEDPSRPVDKTTWFDFDRLLFATGSASLEPASTEQLTNIAAILQAYPKVDIRIGGYTDNTGDPAVNLTLSQERATTVMGELAKLDVDPSRMDAKGYGEEHPVADNSTEAGRALNRRISLRVTAK
jgi:outer membrane protein OmpA-like peptidoglycan-associated protein